VNWRTEVNLRPTLSRSVCLGVGVPPGTKDQIRVSVWQLRVSCCGVSSQTSGRLCNLLVQLLLGLARAVTLGSNFCRTHDHIVLSHLRLPQPERPGPLIYIPQEQCVPVIPPGTGFPFRRLLRLAGLRWKYSNQLSHGRLIDWLKSKLYYGRKSVTRFLFSGDNCGILAVGRPLWREAK
jgi:hypothetical protein